MNTVNPPSKIWIIAAALTAIYVLAGFFSIPGGIPLVIGVLLILLALGRTPLLGWLNTAAVDRTRQVEVWRAAYTADYAALLTTGLPLLIAEDEMWNVLLTHGTANTARFLIPPPKSSSDRLIYATAFWEVVLAYARGERRDFSEQLIARRQIVQQLQSNDAALRGTYNCAWLARFTALHDFFHGAQD